MLDRIILLFFICSFLFFWYQSYEQISKNLEERQYYKNLFISYVEAKEDNSIEKEITPSIKILNQWGLTLTISKIKKNIQEVQVQKSLFKYQENQQKILDLSKTQVDYTNSILYIPWYIEKKRAAPIIFAKDNTTTYSDLKKWVRVVPESQKPSEKWITFIEGHSGQNYSNTLSYSFFDSLSLYYDSIPYNLPIYIETKDYIFEYHLFKKEIILPWEKEFYWNDFYHLILMTCYPRNTNQKRALFHWKLTSITKKK